jgi:hypothetical protein
VFLAGGAVLVLALVLAQLLLPRLAAARIRSRLSRYGSVQSVQVSAWPAIKLLWGSVDSVRVRARELSLSTERTESLLWEAHATDELTLSAGSVRIGSLRLRSVELSKRGSQLQARALASASAVQQALPPGTRVELLGSGGGQVEVRVGGALFGIGASLEAVAMAQEGRLVVKPLGGLLGALQLTLFEDPHVYVEGIAAHVERGDRPGYRLSLSALLR